MEAKKINMAEYIESGEGANGSSYDSISDPDVMVKLYNKSYDKNAIVLEHELAKKVYELGVPSPEPGELVTDGERLGIRFRRIRGKRSYSRAFSMEPARVEELSREFARECKAFHSIECPEGLFPDARDSFQMLLDADKVLSPYQKERVSHFLWEEVPAATTLLHGDMHFGNALTTLPVGAPLSDPHEIYFIDLGYVTRGCPLMDLGMTYNICNLADEEFILHDMHFGRETAARAWAAFEDEYFFGPERLAEKWFGPGADTAAVIKGLEPYAFLKLLLVEYNLGFLPPNYEPFFKNVFPDKK